MTLHSQAAAKAVWGPRRRREWLAIAVLLAVVPGAHAATRPTGRPHATKARTNAPNAQARRGTLDHELDRRSSWSPLGSTKVIVTLQPGAGMPAELKNLATRTHRQLNSINGQVITVPNRFLKSLASHPSVLRVDFDRPIGRANYRTALTTGARAVQGVYGLTGAGVGVAVIDSGIASWHDDLTPRLGGTYPYGNQRVKAFVDFVNGRTTPYDDDGHGTHVAGIIAGNGYDSNGQKAGMAPDADLVALKVLDANGNGTISNIIAAFDWILANHARYNIRVVNISVGARINESYWTDPLTLAAKRLVDAGVVVVSAAGNAGKNAAGQSQYGGLSAPGNAPWVLTVGASSTQGTASRSDDIVAGFSSRGPTFKDWSAKPDLVAPGTGTVSLAAPGSTLYATKLSALVGGLLSTPFQPYLSLSGTSMAAPVVSGTVALMLQANPNLTPNLVKAILEYTAQSYPGYDALTQGAGFLNTLGAVRVAQFFAYAPPGTPLPTQSIWGKQIIWGNHRLTGGAIKPSANAFRLGTTWGAAKSDADENIVWGTADGDENIVWGTACGDDTCDNIVWGTADGDENIVWGTDCGGADCENVVWGTVDTDENIVWGTADIDENIVWGTACDSSGCSDENIVWGTADADENIVWGTADADENIVWGTSTADGSAAWTAGATTSTPTLSQVIALAWLMRFMNDQQVFGILGLFDTPPPPPSPPPPPTLVTTTSKTGGLF